VDCWPICGGICIHGRKECEDQRASQGIVILPSHWAAKGAEGCGERRLVRCRPSTVHFIAAEWTSKRTKAKSGNRSVSCRCCRTPYKTQDGISEWRTLLTLAHRRFRSLQFSVFVLH